MKNKINLKTERMKGYGPYLVDEYEVNYLYGLNDLCEKYVKNNFTILELGSNDGISTTLFSYFAEKVVSVDIHKTNNMNQVLLENNNIVFYNMSFNDFLKIDKDNKYDLIYIDGDHDFESVNRDIELYKNKIKPNGYISGHDFNSNTLGVKKAVENHFPIEKVITFSDSSWLIEIK